MSSMIKKIETCLPASNNEMCSFSKIVPDVLCLTTVSYKNNILSKKKLQKQLKKSNDRHICWAKQKQSKAQKTSWVSPDDESDTLGPSTESAHL